MKVTLIYTRVSTQRQADEGVSLDAQEAECRAYCERHQLGNVEVLRDEGFSGKSLDRPGMQELLRRVAADEVGDVVVTALDRLSRKTTDALGLVGDTFDGTVGFHAVRQAMDTTGPVGKAMVGMLALFNELERDMIAERTREAAAHCFGNGLVFGRTPYGYARGADPQDNTLHRHPEEWPTLESMRARRAAGMTYQTLADELNAAGTPTKMGRRWFAASVRSVLTRKRNGLEPDAEESA